MSDNNFDLKSATEAGKKAAEDAAAKTKELADKANEASGGWLGNNKGLLIGGIAALFALFGMEGPYLPSMLAIGALIVGVFMDKDTGVFKKIFGKKEVKIAPDGQERVRAQDVAPATAKGEDVSPPAASVPSVPTPSAASVEPTPEIRRIAPVESSVSEVENGKRNKELSKIVSLGMPYTDLYVDSQGNKRNPPLNGIPSLMKIKADKGGNVTEVAVANEKGRFDSDDKDEVIMTKIPKDKNIFFEVHPDSKSQLGYINLGDKWSEMKLKELREIGKEALLKRAADKPLKRSKDSSPDGGEVQSASLGELASQSSLPRKLEPSIEI